MARAFNIYITNCPERHPDDENNEELHASTLGLITMETECFHFVRVRYGPDKAEIIPQSLHLLFKNIYETKAAGTFDTFVCR
jgi:hypothetical protein